MSNIIARNMYM